MAEPPKEQKPGTGIDRTTIRQMLALSPAERARVAIEAARTMAAIHHRIRRQ